MKMKKFKFEKSYCGEFDCVSFRNETGVMIYANNADGKFKVMNYKDIPLPRAKKLEKVEREIEEAFHAELLNA